MSSPKKRKETDLMKLIMNNHKVETINDEKHEFYVHLNGPADTPYFGGVWKVRVELPDDYPYSSPSVGFVTKIYHPNIHEASGTVCVDLLNHNWKPAYDLVNVFEHILPQLLHQPNPGDPLNKDAAALLLRDPSAYEEKIKVYRERYAKPGEECVIEDERPREDEEEEESSDEEESEDDDGSEDEVNAAGDEEP